MADAPPLIELAGFAYALGCAYCAYVIAKALVSAFNINIPLVGRPFAGIATALESSLVSWLETVVTSLEAKVTKALSDTADSLAILLGLNILLAEGVKAALEYLWNSALRPVIRTTVATTTTTANHALALVQSLENTVAANVGRAEAYARGQADNAYTRARDWAQGNDRAVLAVLRGEIADATAGLRSAEAAVAGELPAVPGLDWGELENLVNGKNLATLAGLLGAIPLLRALMRTLAAETGLENQACRDKVKQLCATNPAAWENLIAGLAVLGFAFSLVELADLARPMVDGLAVVIGEAA